MDLRAACAVLFVAVVISLRMGAYPIAVRDIVMTLVNGVLGHGTQIPSEFRVWFSDCDCRASRWGFSWGRRSRRPAPVFRRSCGIRWPIRTCWEFRAARRWAQSSSLIVAPHTPGAIQVAAFAGAAVTIAAVYFLGRRGGQLDSATLLLAGIVTASFLSAVIMFLMTTLSGRDLRGMAFWLMGDLASPPTVDSRWLYLVLIVAVGSIYTTSSDLNLILTGEQEARHLGVNVNRVKLVVYVAASVLTDWPYR